MRKAFIAILLCAAIFNIGALEFMCNCHTNAHDENIAAHTDCHERNNKDRCKGEKCCSNCSINKSFLPFALNFTKPQSRPILLELPYRPNLFSKKLIFSHLTLLDENFFIPHHAIDIIKFTYSPQAPPDATSTV